MRWGWVVVGVLLMTLTGAWALWRQAPEWIRQQLELRGSEALNRPVTVQSVTLQLHPQGAFSLALDALEIGDRAGDTATPILKVERLEATVSWWHLLSEQLRLDALHIHGPRLSLQRNAQGEWHLQAWARELAQRRPAGQDDPSTTKPWSVALHDFQVHGGRIDWDDQFLGQQHRVDDLDIVLPKLIWRAENGQEAARMQADWQLDGAQMAVQVAGFPSDWQRPITWQAKAEQWPLRDWWAWLPKDWPVQAREGRLSFQIDGAVTLAPKAPQPLTSATAQGQLRLDELALVGPQGQRWADLSSLAVQLDELDLVQRRVKLGAVRLTQPRLNVSRAPDGQIDLAQWLSRWPASEPGEPWQIVTGPVQVEQAQVDLRDDAAAPTAQWRLSQVSIESPAISWPQRSESAPSSPITVKAGGRLLAQHLPGSKESAAWQVDARVDPDSLHARASVQDVSLSALQPYLTAVTSLSWSGRLGAQGELSWKPKSSNWALTLDRVEAAGVTARSETDDPLGPALAWRQLLLQDLKIDGARRSVQLGRFSWDQPAVGLRRARSGALNVLNWIRAPASSPSAEDRSATAARSLNSLTSESMPPTTSSRKRPVTSSPAEPDWRMSLGDVRVKGGAVSWMDETLPTRTHLGQAEQPWRMALQAIDLETGGLQWPLGPSSRPVPLRLSLRADRLDATQTGDRDGAQALAATLSASGELTPSPLAIRLQVDAQQWPVHRFMPYADAAGVTLPVVVAHANAGWQGQLRWVAQGVDAGADAKGQVQLSGVSLLARTAEGVPQGAGLEALDPELVRWNQLTVDVSQAQWRAGQKPRLDIAQVNISDLFAKLQITPQGQFNVQMGSSSKAGPEAPGAGAVASSAKPAAPKPAAAPAWPLDLVVQRTRLVNGRIDFQDNFIRPNYRADLSQLQGSLGRVSSDSVEAAPLELTGRVAGTGELEIRGSVNPLGSPLSLNVRAKASNIELAPFTPYGGKYLGYAIERGKLSADLSYRIHPDGRLDATNQVILNQLTLGNKVDSPSATNLPVRFALSLLADKNGVIDVNLPISGSINDPQFSIWGLVWKMVGNLIVKAVTAPFSWMASGGSQQTTQVDFEPGSAVLGSTQIQTLTQLASGLKDRAKLQLTLTPSAQAQTEDTALRQARLRQGLIKLQQRRSTTAGTAAANDVLPPRESPAYLQLVRQMYREAPLKDKPRNMVGLLKDLPLAEMEQRLLDAVVIQEDQVRELALQRGLAVRDALMSLGLPASRIFLAAPRLLTGAEQATATPWAVRLELALP